MERVRRHHKLARLSQCREVGGRRDADRKDPAKRRVLILVENSTVPHDPRVWRECRSLVGAGYEVSVICRKRPGDPSYQLLEGVHLYKYPSPPSARGKKEFIYEYVYSWVMAAWLTLRVHRRHGFDVIQACNPPEIYFALALPFKLLGKRFVFDHHDLSPEMYICRFGRRGGLMLRVLYGLERATFRTADHVISTNESFRHIALTRGGKRPDDVTVVRNGPDLERMGRRAARPELKEGKRFLCCWLGAMSPLAGVDLLLRAFHHLVYQLGRHDCHLAILGSGEALEDLKALSRELELGEWVTFTGWAEHELWFDYLSTADLGLQPNPKDPKNDLSTALKTMEYMAFELPVVAFDLKETRVSAGDAAVYARPNDVVEYARAIDQLLSDPERRSVMGRTGRRRVEEGLAWDHQERAYLGVYELLFGSGSGSGPDSRREHAPRPARGGR